MDRLDAVEEDLMTRAFLFTDPISYRDGVEAATEAVRVMLTKAGRAGHRDEPAKDVS